MKLKYYLRGLGMGIIFATLAMTVSSVIHNNNLSDEKIIKEAQKLGMVMPEEKESTQGGLWSKNEDVVESTEEAGTQSVETEMDLENSTEVVNEETTESDAEASQEELGEQVVGENGVTYIIINVYPGDTARLIAERLYENGLVDDAETFRKYLGQTGQANRLHVGEFMVPTGATYEQIFDILMGR